MGLPTKVALLLAEGLLTGLIGNVTRFERIITRQSIVTFLKVPSGIVEQAPSSRHGIGCVARCLRIFRRTNRLARIAHFLNWNRTGTADQ